MADRTSAEIAGKVIRYLHSMKVDDLIITGVWEIVSDADFSPYQAEIDDLVELYGLE